MLAIIHTAFLSLHSGLEVEEIGSRLLQLLITSFFMTTMMMMIFEDEKQSSKRSREESAECFLRMMRICRYVYKTRREIRPSLEFEPVVVGSIHLTTLSAKVCVPSSPLWSYEDHGCSHPTFIFTPSSSFLGRQTA